MTAQTAPPRPAPPHRPEMPVGLRLVPTLRNIEAHYGKEEMAAAIELWADEAQAAKVARAFEVEIERYKQAQARWEKEEREAADEAASREKGS